MYIFENIKKIFSLENSKTEHQESEQTYEQFAMPIFHETFEPEEEPQYQSVPVDKNIFGNKSVSRISQMKKIKSSNSYFSRAFGAKDIQQFILQAKFMVDFEDNYNFNKEIPFENHFPTYMDMNLKQLRCYFSWRTFVRKGVINKIPISYAYVYIYELINLIGIDDPIFAFQKLAVFWLAYRKHNAGIDSYMQTILKDFYICNDFSESFKELVDNTGLQSFFSDVFMETHSDYIYSRLLQMSDYRLENSKFATSNNEISSFIEKCFAIVVDNLAPTLLMYGITISDLTKGELSNGIWYKPFSSAIYFQQVYKEKMVYISGNEYYHYDGYNWSLFTPDTWTSHSATYFIGYIVKKIEAELRMLCGYKHKLKPNTQSAIDRIAKSYSYQGSETLIRVMYDSDFDGIICETIASCFLQSPSFDCSLVDVDTQNNPLSKHLLHLAKQEPYLTFIKMRNVKNEPNSKRGLANKFCQQAEILQKTTDDFDEVSEYVSKMPNFDEMTNAQLRTYLTWKTNYKAGTIVETIPHSYVKLYAFEVINYIEAHNGIKIIEKLSNLLHAYPDLGEFFTELIKDYYICNPMDCSFSDLILNSGLESYYPIMFFGDTNIKNPLLFYGKISNYKIFNSKFYTNDNIDMLNNCFQECLKQAIAFFDENNLDFRSLLINKTNGDKGWKPFRRAIYKFSVKPAKKSTIIKLSEGEIYSYSRSQWTNRNAEKLDMAASHLIGFIFKRMESKIREIVKFKSKITAEAETMVQKIPNNTQNHILISKLMLTPSFSDLIDETVVTYFQKNHPNVFINPDSIYKKPVKVNVDFSKLSQIRSESAEIQDKLLITNEPPAIHYANSHIQENKENTGSMIDTNNMIKSDELLDEWIILASSLANNQRDVLSIILNGKDVSEKLAQFAVNNHLMIEVLLEKINEIALEHIGDNIIETNDNPVYIYDDYANELNRVLFLDRL